MAGTAADTMCHHDGTKAVCCISWQQHSVGFYLLDGPSDCSIMGPTMLTVSLMMIQPPVLWKVQSQDSDTAFNIFSLESYMFLCFCFWVIHHVKDQNAAYYTSVHLSLGPCALCGRYCSVCHFVCPWHSGVHIACCDMTFLSYCASLIVLPLLSG